MADPCTDLILMPIGVSFTCELYYTFDELTSFVV